MDAEISEQASDESETESMGEYIIDEMELDLFTLRRRVVKITVRAIIRTTLCEKWTHETRPDDRRYFLSKGTADFFRNAYIPDARNYADPYASPIQG